MTALENTLWVLVLIGVMILIHELGHYWAARYFDVYVESFSFGFGPRLFGFRRGETDFRVSAIPFGGYVKMMGEQTTDKSVADDPRSFLAKPRWQRLIIAFAGPWMNIVLAVGLLAGLYMFQYPKQPESATPGVLGAVLPDGAAAKAGFREGDRITSINQVQVGEWDDVMFQVAGNPGRPLRVVFERGGKETEATLTPEIDSRDGIGTAGWVEQSEVQVGGVQSGFDAERKGLKAGDVLVSINGNPIRSAYRLRETVKNGGGQPVEIVYRRDGRENTVTLVPTEGEAEPGKKSWLIGVQLQPRVVFVQLPFLEAVSESVKSNIKGAGLIYEFLKGVVERRMSPKSLEGPIRIAQLSGDAAREGPGAFISLMAMVSLNLAIFNLLPIPVLDGGMILMLLVEMVARRDVSLNIKEAVTRFGFVFLLMLVMFVLYNDIRKVMPMGG
jgi:regulator of sigma E protease